MNEHVNPVFKQMLDSLLPKGRIMDVICPEELPTLWAGGALMEDEAYCYDAESKWYGWIFKKDPYVPWRPGRQTGEAERRCIEESLHYVKDIIGCRGKNAE